MLFRLRRIWTKTNDGLPALPLTDTALLVAMESEAAALPGFISQLNKHEPGKRVMVYEFDNVESAKTLHRAYLDGSTVFGRYLATVKEKAAGLGTTYELSWLLSKVLAILLLLFAATGVSAADLRLVIPSSPSGTYDQVGRLFARSLGYVPQNLPGASGVIGANALYKAPPDGSVLGLVHTAAIEAQALGEPSVRFDAGKFNWLGTPTRDGGTVVVWHTSKVRTFDDLLTTEVTVGVSNIRQLAYVRLMNQVLGTKFKIIRGYESGAHIALAIQRGEVDCSVVYPWSVWRTSHPDLVSAHKVIPIVQLGLTHERSLRIPLLADLSPVFAPLAAIDGMGRPLALPPGASPEIVTKARDLYGSALKSPVFLADAEKIGLDVDPVPADELARLVNSVITMPAETKAIIKRAID